MAKLDEAFAQSVAARGGVIAHAAPFVGWIDDFLDADDCAAIIAAAREAMSPAVVSGPSGGQVSAGRTNSVAWVKHDRTPVVLMIAERVADVVGLPLAHAESLQVIHYAPGQEYRPHFDAYDPATERGQRAMARGGQRLATTLCYLNPVEAGGATIFPDLDVTVDPVPGRLCLFANCGEDGVTRSPLVKHGGAPVAAGEKWAFNLWFRERPRTG